MGIVDVVQHIAEIARRIVGQAGGGHRILFFQKGKIGGELTATQTRLLEALAIPCAAPKDVDVLAFVVRRAGFVRQLEMGLDDVIHMPQQQGGPLLAAFVGEQVQGRAVLCRIFDAFQAGALFRDLVAPDAVEHDGVQDVDPVHEPAYGRFPVDGFKDAAHRRWRGDIIAAAFPLVFRAGEQGIVAPDP